MIYSIKDIPEYKNKAVDWFSSKWGIPKKEYEKSFCEALSGDSPLPQWYIALNENGDIVGGCGLIENDFVDRTDLKPYVCAVFVEPKYRLQRIAFLLLLNVRRHASELGFEKLYLCTDHTSFYERCGWHHIGFGTQLSGDISRIYEAETIRDSELEDMGGFFAKRLSGYEHQMLVNVEGCRDGYKVLAENVPENAEKILDLGCGTGLELDEIFKLNPNISVTGIDLSEEMLGELKRKHGDKKLDLRCESYFDSDFGKDSFDSAISFQTMHHFPHEKKVKLYEKIRNSLKNGGVYIEGDYMAKSQFEEDFYYAENARLRKKQNIPDGAFYHYDTPCTAENQREMLLKAGFSEVKKVFQQGNTVILIAKK